jgi:hypothetical protein
MCSGQVTGGGIAQPSTAPRTTVFNRWSSYGLWRRLFEQCSTSDGIPEELAIDVTHSKNRRSIRARGKKRGRDPSR